MRKQFIFITFIFYILCHVVYADQSIQIVGGTKTGLTKLAIVQFKGNSLISDIIANDLSITGEFNVIQYNDVHNVSPDVQYILTGTVNESNVLFSLNNNKGTGSGLSTSMNQGFTFTLDNTRTVAHSISNAVYKQLTNTDGIYKSKIAYIVKNGSQYSLIVSDYDGYNQHTLLTVNAPIISIAWDKTGQQIAYTTYESNKPVVYVQNIYTGTRYSIADFKGSNSSPSFTSDMKQVAVTLTKDNGSHIYLVPNSSFHKHTQAVNMINFGTIDTEADIGSNNMMVFTSNHDGGPQIFKTNGHDATPVRLTLNLGNYNTSAHLSHDLSKIVFINRNQGILKTYVLNLSTQISYPVSLTSTLDTAPSFSPNDKLILLSSDNNMYIINTLGTIQIKLNNIHGHIINQMWANDNPQ